MEEGVAKSTRQAYVRAWRAFTEFLAKLDSDPRNWEDRIVMFFTHLSEKGKASSTIRTYLAGVKARLRMENVVLNENHYMMKIMYKASAKRDVERVRLPITLEMLTPMLRRVGLVVKDDFEKLVFKAIFTTAYFGAFRIGELVGSEHAVKNGNVVSSRTSEKVRILMHSSKMSKPGQLPEVVVIEPAPGGAEWCPCDLIQQFSDA